MLAFTVTGQVVAVLITPPGASISESPPKRKIELVRNHGVRGDRHAGFAGERLSDVREVEFLSHGLLKHMEIANHREVSIVSVEELGHIGTKLELTAPIPHGLLGENLVVSGIPRLTEIPSGSLIFFSKDGAGPRTAVIAVWRENTPCIIPARNIQDHFPDHPGIKAGFVDAAKNKRGLVGSVFCSGVVSEGDIITVHIPEQRIYMRPGA